MNIPKIKLRQILLYFIFCLSISSSNAQVQAEYFVSPNGNDANRGTIDSPFATIQAARDAVRLINQNMTGDIIIYLREGVYPLMSVLKFDNLDSGTNGFSIRYKAYQCEKPLISGGKKITGWVLHDPVKNIYKAELGMTMETRQLYVNGVRAVRARSINAKGWTESGDGYNCPADIKNWKNIMDVEVVSFWEWKCHRGPISSVSNTHAVMAQPYWSRLHTQGTAPPVWIENAYELLDAEREWYLDRPGKTLYYKPAPYEDMSMVETIVPLQEILISGDNVKNLSFQGITFSYATWLLPNTNIGFPCLQADYYYPQYTQMLGHIVFKRSTGILFEGNNFCHMGAGALQMTTGCRNSWIVNNSFSDISGTAIAIGNTTSSPTASDSIKFITVENNLIRNVALEYFGCVGILVVYAANVTIKHNEIRNLPYTGISVGWGWKTTITYMRENIIGHNYLDSTMQVLKDGGPIYTLSAQPGTQVFNNYLKNMGNSAGALYPDQGSSYMRWHHNVIRNSNNRNWLYIYFSSTQADTFDNNYYDFDDARLNGSNCVIENNVYVTNNNWPPVAKEIMGNAGIQNAPAIQSFSLSYDSLKLFTGSKSQLKTSVYPCNAVRKSILWYSDNDSIAGITPTGQIIARKPGEAKISAKTEDGKFTDVCLVKCMTFGNDTSRVSSLIISYDTILLDIFKSRYVPCTLLPENSANKIVYWTTSNPSIVYIGEDGKITGRSAGSAKVFAKSDEGNFSDSLLVIVNIPLNNIHLAQDSLILSPGETFRLTTTFSPLNATNKNVYWQSSDSDIVSVNEEGVITAIKSGTAFIYVISSDRSKSDTCKVTVQNISEINPVNLGSFSIYPNPVNGKINITILTQTKEDVQIRIFCSAGQLRKEFFIREASEHICINIEDLWDGMYLMEIIFGNRNYHHKIIVSK